VTVGELAREGEGGEGFYIAQTGRPADLLVIWGGGRTGRRSRRHCLSSSGSERRHPKLAQRWADRFA